MAKEYTWNLNGKEISCEDSGNKYFIYEGEKFITTIYKKTFGNVDEELTLCGVTCRFVVTKERPDIAVDGVFIGSGEDYDTKASKQRKSSRIFGIAELAAGIAVLCFMIAKYIGGDKSFWILPVAAAAAAFAVFGAWDIWANRKK